MLPIPAGPIDRLTEPPVAEPRWSTTHMYEFAWPRSQNNDALRHGLGVIDDPRSAERALWETAR